MIDIDIAVFEITEAMRRKQRIGIFGDYDVPMAHASLRATTAPHMSLNG